MSDAVVSASTNRRRGEALPVAVLVHGSFHGAWVWRDVVRRLHGQGMESITPSLTGSGEKHHLASPDVRLETHIEDVCAAVRLFGANSVVIVGHAASGLAISGAADRLRSDIDIRRLIYFDAKAPTEGDMSFINTRSERSAAFFEKHRQSWDDGWMMDFTRNYPIEMLAPASRPDIQALLKDRLTRQPCGPWIDELEYAGAGIDGIPKRYIVPAAQTTIPTPAMFYKFAENDPEWVVSHLPVHRDGMLTEPRIVADYIAAEARAAAQEG